MSRILDALRRVEAERDALRAAHPPPGAGLDGREWIAPPSRRGRWWARRRTREAARATRRAQRTAEHAALLGRLDSIERRLGELDETVAKQLGALEPRLLHALELHARGLERELASLASPPAAPRAEQAPRGGWRAVHPAWLGVAVFALGVGVARCFG